MNRLDLWSKAAPDFVASEEERAPGRQPRLQAPSPKSMITPSFFTMVLALSVLDSELALSAGRLSLLQKANGRLLAKLKASSVAAALRGPNLCS